MILIFPANTRILIAYRCQIAIKTRKIKYLERLTVCQRPASQPMCRGSTIRSFFERAWPSARHHLVDTGRAKRIFEKYGRLQTLQSIGNVDTDITKLTPRIFDGIVFLLLDLSLCISQQVVDFD